MSFDEVKKMKIKFGIIGHGFMGHEHETMLTKMEGIEVVGIADRDPKQLEDVKEDPPV